MSYSAKGGHTAITQPEVASSWLNKPALHIQGPGNNEKQADLSVSWVLFNGFGASI